MTPTPPTPGALGYRRPAEWDRHEATWLTWPHCQDTWPGVVLAEAVEPAYVAMIDALRHGEAVNVCVLSDDHAATVADRLRAGGVASGHGTPVRLRVVPTDDEWVRDYGALFVRDGAGRRIATDWVFNAWGGKYDRTERNNTVPAAMAAAYDAERVAFPVVLEGGSVEVNGAGLALTTESCLLNPNRNPGLGKADIERLLFDGLGVTETVWLGDGIAGDDTDGHVDDMTRFVGERTVVTAVEPDPDDANHEPLAENLARLKAWRGRDGRGLEIVELPMPPALFHTPESGAPGGGAAERLPASYANFLVANAATLMPSFGVPEDDRAAAVLERVLDRPVARIPARDLVWGLGACHCLSQDVPAGR
ncbi:agmatine deiminase family protein [Rubrivirga sp. S365]|uniref:agmatine deiminase family protein n=1 Tax=Rubrivirga sp. S365 TaxID=3076080 RepID=UPI0028C95FBA|nr:agmatine deiminase family protein [Rubrivirga sp. S365]MDT7856595.1 agmatine deiminase family protein [Rubrivirga sp. S365]